MSEETADLLAGGREYIEKNGWWRNGLFGPNGKQACLVGGLLAHLGLTMGQECDPRIATACRTLVSLTGKNVAGYHATSQVEWWNDHLAKNKQEVLDLLAKAEKIERAGYDPDE